MFFCKNDRRRNVKDQNCLFIAFNQVIESYNHASSVAIPTRHFSIHKRPCPKWSNDKIKHLTKRKYKLHFLVRSAPLNPELRAAMVCKQVKSAVRQSIRKFEESIVGACLLDKEDAFCTDGGTIANLLNAHFGSVFIPRLSSHAPSVQSFASPQREVYVVCFSPANKDEKMLEQVQRRATKLVPRIRNWRYEDRLAVLRLTPLNERRVRGDLIQMFKLTKGINEVSWVNSPVPASSLSQPGPARGIRGHARRLSGQASTKCLQRANTFTNRIVNEWNALPVTVTDADSVNKFKNGYDVFRSSQQS
ncbi:RNA-directed DNA polymerase from mobile element jockey-like [Brachionus plicatilis]|uniref:RNA-directed DNA polymerase from mobile element jockey-like n=1 Tax=Brachionus plicatilis TaxID=10195 RepID=A0A3M7T0W5_BRAPC|nr:RNA-directed DNA polymerase from mobile element jockey-like [Brachionus plicatilis]